MDMRGLPLNGTKTHPLSAHAKDVLASIARSPIPRQNVNAGVVDRLSREDLVETVSLPSPFASHKGRNIDHLKITGAGLAVLAAVDQ